MEKNQKTPSFMPEQPSSPQEEVFHFFPVETPPTETTETPFISPEPESIEHVESAEPVETSQTETTQELSAVTEQIAKAKKGRKYRGKNIPQVRDAIVQEVEYVMEEGLQDAFQEMTAVEQQEFTLKGEETAFKIRALLRGSKVKVKKIFQLLFDWLKLLPGIDKYYLMQEAKIKTDKIASIRNKYPKV